MPLIFMKGFYHADMYHIGRNIYYIIGIHILTQKDVQVEKVNMGKQFSHPPPFLYVSHKRKVVNQQMNSLIL